MNRLEYLAHNGDPEEIIEEVMSALKEKDEEISRLELENFELNKGICFLKQEIDELRAEVAALRKYGNKDCTAMADAELRQE